ncbi:hypothetical protein BGX27_002464 [Mortierella sp. AM989]|nr:hypothetical protein BGX27_002464 [Mortierella sp. AM989]
MPKKPKSKPEPEKRKPARNVRETTKTMRDANSSTVTKQPSTPAKQESVLLELNCIVEGEASSFPVNILSTEKVGILKQAIKNATKPDLDLIAAKNLILKLISGGATKIGLSKLSGSSLKELDNELEKLSTYFPDGAAEDRIHIIVEPPQQDMSFIPDEASFHTNITRGSPPGSPLSGHQKNCKRIFAPDSTYAKFLKEFAQNQHQLPLTTGKIPGLPRVSLRKRPDINQSAKPNLLFLDLPDPSKGVRQSEFPTSMAISDLIAKCNTGFVPVFGTGGSEKTRGMLELLAQQWGFYFNSTGDDIGSDDMTTLKSEAGEKLHDENKEINNTRVKKSIYLLFLARLHILQYLLNVTDSNRTFTCARWTLLQACPPVFNAAFDIFNILFRRFLILQWDTASIDTLSRVVRQEFSTTRDLIRHRTFSDFEKTTALFAVLDEAQILGDQLDGRFISETDEKLSRSLLSPVLYGLRNVAAESELTIITSGTGLSIYTLTWVPKSGFIQEGLSSSGNTINGFPYMEFPCWTTRESVVSYIVKIRNLLQDEEAKLVLDGLLPPEAISLMIQRLVGRFRPITKVIEKIIELGDPDGWKEAVGSIESGLTSYENRKMKGNLVYELIRMEKKYNDNLDAFKEPRSLEVILGLLLFQRYMFGVESLVLRGSESELVVHALGRIKY